MERILTEIGVFIIISYGNPQQRLHFLEQHDLDVPYYTPWTIEVQALRKLIAANYMSSGTLIDSPLALCSEAQRVPGGGAGLCRPQLLLLCVHMREAEGHGAAEEDQAGSADSEGAEEIRPQDEEGSELEADGLIIHVCRWFVT